MGEQLFSYVLYVRHIAYEKQCINAQIYEDLMIKKFSMMDLREVTYILGIKIYGDNQNGCLISHNLCIESSY